MDQSLLLAEISEEVKQRFALISDPAHNWQHIERVYALSRALAEAEGGDIFVISLAALLHDLGHLQADHDRHVDISLSDAQELMTRYAIAAEIRAQVAHAIEAHSFSRGVAAKTLEAHIVRDADRLDALGAIGMIRWAVTGVLRRRDDTLIYQTEDPFAKNRALDDQHYMLDHFYRKLLKLGETISTASGKRLAEERLVFMEQFLLQLAKEIGV